jgi:hypothetical protein
MSRKNFYISMDRDGNMPVLSAKAIPTKKAWIKYVNDTPVAIKPYVGMTQVWDYARSEFLGLSPETKTYAGKPMPRYTGLIVAD